MKKLLLLASAIFLTYSSNFAQFKTISESATFNEPGKGFAKLIKSKNGFTYFLHFEKNGTLNIKAFNPQQQQVFEKSVNYLEKGEKANDIKGIYEINEQVVCFLENSDERAPVLKRLIIDGKTGAVLENKELGRYRKVRMADGYAFAFGRLPVPTFYVRKDPQTENYAVALFNTFAEDRNERIEVFHYDKNNNLITKSFYNSPNDGYKYMQFMDMYVDSDKAVYVVSLGSNTAKSGGDQSGGLFVGKLDKGSTSFQMEKMPYVQAKNIEGVILRYNAATEKFLMLSNKYADSKGKDRNYNVSLATFDKSIENYENRILNFSALNTIAKRDFKKKAKLNAIPQSLYINDDGSYTIILEETLIKTVVSHSGGGNNGMGVSTTRNYYYLNDIGIVHYNKDNSLKAANYIPKSQRVNGTPSIFDYSFREEKPISLGGGFQYKSFNYIDAPGSNYVLFNDIEANQEKMKKGKNVTTIQDLGASEGFYFKVSNKGIPNGEKLIDSNKKKERMLLLFSSAYYDKASNQYIVLKTDKSKKSSILWLQPE